MQLAHEITTNLAAFPVFINFNRAPGKKLILEKHNFLVYTTKKHLNLTACHKGQRLFQLTTVYFTSLPSAQSNIHQRLNTLRRRPYGRHFQDDIFKCIFLNENVQISIKSSLKFVPWGPINNIPSLVEIMAWRRPQWVKLWWRAGHCYNATHWRSNHDEMYQISRR